MTKTHARYPLAAYPCPCGNPAVEINTTGPVCQRCLDIEAKMITHSTTRRTHLGKNGYVKQLGIEPYKVVLPRSKTV